MESVKVGIIGLGTVGSGTFNILTDNASEIARRVGKNIEVSHIGARRDNPLADTSNHQVSRDIWAVVNDPEIQILVELIGGTTLAKELVEAAIEQGKHIVTANKALIAEYGNELFALAKKHHVQIAFEAAVAGGIPAIKALREGLAGNKIQTIAGIINGTGNFILTEMEERQAKFADVLKEAQELGYAEADPTFDVEGIDAAHKLAILASLAFGTPLNFNAVYTEGITKITPADIDYARELGFKIKHLGIAQRAKSGIEMRVHPTLIPKTRLLSQVNGVMNAIEMEGDQVGPTMYYGPGAGALPTGSAVVADIIDVVRQMAADASDRIPYQAFQDDQLVDETIVPMDEVRTGFYIRITAADEAGVLSGITRLLSEHNINIQAIIQKPNDKQDDNTVPIIILVQRSREGDVSAALEKIAALEHVNSDITRIRAELN